MRPENSGLLVSIPESITPIVTPDPLAPAAHAAIAPCCEGPVEVVYSVVWKLAAGVGVSPAMGVEVAVVVGVGVAVGVELGVELTLPPPPPPQAASAASPAPASAVNGTRRAARSQANRA